MKCAFRELIIATAALCLTAFFATASLAQSPSETDIIEALLSRPEAADHVTGSRSLFNGKKRGVTTEGGRENAPSINLKVNFEFDSEKLENEALLTLDTLGRALSSDELKGKRIEIIGHTDAKGTEIYNDDLSDRRAAAVVSYIVSHFNLDVSLISSEGMGERSLLDSKNPEDEINRRVEIRNVTDVAQ